MSLIDFTRTFLTITIINQSTHAVNSRNTVQSSSLLCTRQLSFGRKSSNNKHSSFPKRCWSYAGKTAPGESERLRFESLLKNTSGKLLRANPKVASSK